MSFKNLCDVCGHMHTLEKGCREFNCEQCGTHHEYHYGQWDVFFTDDQKRILIWLARGAVVYVNVSDGECSPEGVFSSEDLAKQAMRWPQHSVDFVLDKPE